MNCPNCSAQLRIVCYEGVNVETCDKCGGEFVEPDELAHIVKSRQSHFGKHLQDLMKDHKPMFGKPAGQSDQQRTCPACSGAMQLVNYGGDTGVGVDRCDDCGGLWLDHDEIEKVQLIMEKWQDEAPAKLNAIAGQLEMARRQAAERTSKAFAGSRFSFVNALINRLLDAA
jgi:Zn-finger nucleic acid-binding protein